MAKIVATPTHAFTEETDVCDPADRLVLRTALASNSEVLVTGDKDLLDSGLVSLRIVSPREFLEL